jgi:hypothetical protein
MASIIGGKSVLSIRHSKATLDVGATNRKTDDEKEESKSQRNYYQDKVDQLNRFEFQGHFHL